MAAHFYFPEDFNLDHIDTMLRAFTRDIKYTKDWGCESCGKPPTPYHRFPSRTPLRADAYLPAAAGDPAQEVVFEYIADSPSGLKLVVASVRI